MSSYAVSTTEVDATQRTYVDYGTLEAQENALVNKLENIELVGENSRIDLEVTDHGAINRSYDSYDSLTEKAFGLADQSLEANKYALSRNRDIVSDSLGYAQTAAQQTQSTVRTALVEATQFAAKASKDASQSVLESFGKYAAISAVVIAVAFIMSKGR